MQDNTEVKKLIHMRRYLRYITAHARKLKNQFNEAMRQGNTEAMKDLGYEIQGQIETMERLYQEFAVLDSVYLEREKRAKEKKLREQVIN